VESNTNIRYSNNIKKSSKNIDEKDRFRSNNLNNTSNNSNFLNQKYNRNRNNN